MLKLEIFDKNFEFYGQVNKFSSVSFTQKFDSVGTFDLWCPINNENSLLIQRDRFILIEEDVSGIISFISKEEKKMHVKGYLTVGLLKRRCIFPTIIESNVNPAKAAADFVYKLFVNSRYAGNNLHLLRFVSNFEVKEQDYSAFGSEKITTQATGTMLDAKLEDLAQAYNFGFDILADAKSKKFIFQILKSEDRSIDQKKNPPVVLSSDFSSILTSSYLVNASSYANDIFCAGQDNQQNEREWVFLSVDGKSYSGFDRIESFVDARDISIEDDQGIFMDSDAYGKLLLDRAKERSVENELSETYNASILLDASPFAYKKDFQLGDKITIEDKILNVKVNAKITEVTKEFSSSGINVNFTFGYEKPLLMNSLRRKGVI